MRLGVGEQIHCFSYSSQHKQVIWSFSEKGTPIRRIVDSGYSALLGNSHLTVISMLQPPLALAM